MSPDQDTAEHDGSNEESTNHQNDMTINMDRLTNKKKEYLNDAIIDKNGAYSYLDDP
jgi:hypothetical protein